MSFPTGEKFPSFTGVTPEGESVNLQQTGAGKNVVVFFYPRATTAGCVRETTEFGERQGEFDALNTMIVGVSVDALEYQKKHVIQCAANFPVLSDLDKSLTTSLGILNERGLAMRTTYLLDGSGTVQRVFADVKVDGHVSEVLEAVKQLVQ